MTTDRRDLFKEGFGVSLPEYYGYKLVELMTSNSYQRFYTCPACGALVPEAYVLNHEEWHDRS